MPATGKDLALVVQELLQEVGILVVDVLDAVTLETAVLFILTAGLDLVLSGRSNTGISFVFVVSHWVLLLVFLFLFLTESLLAALLVEGSVVLTDFDGQVTDHALIVTELLLEGSDDRAGGVVFHVSVVGIVVSLDGVFETLLTPMLDVDELTAVGGDVVFELAYRVLVLLFVLTWDGEEGGFVLHLDARQVDIYFDWHKINLKPWLKPRQVVHRSGSKNWTAKIRVIS